MQTIIKRVKAPVRIDFGGGTTDIGQFSSRYGGAVLNATINHYVTGKLIKTSKNTYLEYNGTIPTASGLGTSSAMNVVWLALISNLKDKKDIAEGVYRIEQSIFESKINGKQDMYASCYGGINFMEFEKDNVKVTRLQLNKEFINELNSRLVLVYSGKSHISGSSNGAAIKNFLEGKNNSNLLRIKEIAYQMKKALLKKDLINFAYLMNEETLERKKLSKQTLSPKLQSIIDLGLSNGGVAAKICGSGGGGSVLFFAEDKKKMLKCFKEKVIDFKFDFEGLKWL